MLQTLIPGMSLKQKRAGRNAYQIGRLSPFAFTNKIFNHFKTSRSVLARISAADRILVVDDVMTTGLTMRTIFNQLKELGAQSVEGLVIASSS